MSSGPDPTNGKATPEAAEARRLIRLAWLRIGGATLSLVAFAVALFVLFEDGLPGGDFGYFFAVFYFGIACFNYGLAIRDRLKAGRRIGDDLPLIAGLVVVVLAMAIVVVIGMVG